MGAGVSGASGQVSNEALEEDGGLHRSLTNRHMQMIAIGGAIGTGLFVASGATVSTAGPGGALVAYAAIGLMVLLLMQSLGEMTAHMPVAGSFQTYATRFVSPSFGFAMGWNYWFNWAITVAAELVAAGIVMGYWLPGVPSWIWAALFLALLTTLNALSARAFGEGEFWLSAIKVVTVVVFLVAGLAMIAGIIGGTSRASATGSSRTRPSTAACWRSCRCSWWPGSPSRAPSWWAWRPVRPATRAGTCPRRSTRCSGGS